MEYTKNNIITDLKNANMGLEKLIKMYERREIMDDDTKIQINDLCVNINHIIGNEQDKEIHKQKSEGKKFISDEDVDKIINDIVNE